MDEFDQIVENSITSREEVEMVSNAQSGTGQDIVDELDKFVQHARYQAFNAYRLKRFE